MTHFGLVCVPLSSHLNTMLSLGRELRQRGHQVTLSGLVDTQPKAVEAGVDFCAFGESTFPPGAMAECVAQQGILSGIAVWKQLNLWAEKWVAAFCEDMPDRFRQLGVEALLVDAGALEGGTVAELLGLPFATINSSVLINEEPNIPHSCTPWHYNPTVWSRWRNQLGYGFFNFLDRAYFQTLFKYRRQWNLPIYSVTTNTFPHSLSLVRCLLSLNSLVLLYLHGAISPDFTIDQHSENLFVSPMNS
jgi:zeaxanthin glucosyltransferase